MENFVLLKIWENGDEAAAMAVIIMNALARTKGFLGKWEWQSTTVKDDNGKVFAGPQILRNGDRDVLAVRTKLHDGRGDMYTYPELKQWFDGGMSGEPPSPPIQSGSIHL